MRWLNDEHLNAAKEKPANADYMRSIQVLATKLDQALILYRNATTH